MKGVVMTTPIGEKLAGGGLLAGWGAWVVAHVAAINGILQTVLLVVSIIATLLAARYHYRRTPK